MPKPLDLVERLRAWSYRRQRLGRPAAEPGEALRDVVAVYSAHPTTPLSLLARSASVAPAHLREMEWRREALRIPAIDVEDIDGGLLLPTDQHDAFAAVEPLDADAIDVLPKWDAYTMGHAPDGRQRLVDDAHLASAYTTAETKVGATAGDGLPLVLHGGRAVASWSHRFAGNRMLVTVSPFEGIALPRRLYEHAFNGVGELLGATAVEVTAAV